MRSLKQYLVGLSSAALVLGSVASMAAPASAASPASPPFSDIAGSSDQGAITFLASIGAINGVGNGLFDPTAPVTRAEFSKMVVNMLGLGNVATALANETPSFKDASKIPTWAWGYVNVAVDDGIIVGYPNHTFGASNTVTDAEAATMLVRAVGDTSQVMAATNSAAWPGNYVTAAYTLGLASGINFVANLPATRGDVAQLMYNAAVSVPVYIAQNTTPPTYTKYPALYMGGASGNNVGGFIAYSGTVTNVNSSSVTISYTGTTTNGVTVFQPSCPTTPVGSTCEPTLNWASSFQLVGATSPAALLNGSVTVLYNTSNDTVAYAALTSGAVGNTGTLADGSTTVPSGFYAMSEGDTPWIVTNNYACSQQGSLVNDTQVPAATSVDNTSCTYYLLLGGSTPQTVQLASVSGSGGTQYEVNPSSDGTDLGIDSANGTVLNATYLTADDTIQYTLNSSNVATVVNETNVNDSIGRVTSTYCVSGCDNSISQGATPQIEISVNGTSYTLNVQPYTTLTLGGKAATLSSSLDNATAYVAVAGGYGTNTSGPTNVGTGDGNAVSIALYQTEETGTVTQVATSSSSVTGQNPDGVTEIVLQPSSGAAATYSVDGNFNGTPQVGQTVTLVLDSSGAARAVISTNTVSSPTVGIVTGAGSTSTLGSSAPTENITVQTSSGTEQYDVNQSGMYGTVSGETVFASAYSASQTAAAGGANNGAILFETTNGYADGVTPAGGANSPTTAPNAMPLYSPANVPGWSGATSDCFDIYSVSSSSVTLEAFQNCGNSNGTADLTNTGNNPFFTVVLGNGFNNSGDSVGFSGLTTGNQAVVYAAQAGGQTYFVVVDSGNSST